MIIAVVIFKRTIAPPDLSQKVECSATAGFWSEKANYFPLITLQQVDPVGAGMQKK